MKKEYLYGIIGLLAGIILTVFIASNAVNANNYKMMQMMGMHINENQSMGTYNNKHMMLDGSMMDNEHGMTMDDMVNDLKGKTGDSFDKLFISEMIEHHQGAIDMAKLAQQNAGHDEIKNLANDIITAQTKEIEMMKDWQKNWDY